MENVTPIYLGGLAPRLGIVNDGPDIGTLAVHKGEKWVPIADLRMYTHLIPKPGADLATVGATSDDEKPEAEGAEGEKS